MHALWPLEASYLRGFLVSMVLLIQGYSFEHQVGSSHFLLLFICLHLGSAVLLIYFKFTMCHVSVEPALVAMTAVMHRANPKIHTDGLERTSKVPFAIEPRWHIWMVLALLLLSSTNFPATLAAHCAGLVAGGLSALRDPDAWVAGFEAFRARRPGVGRAIHLGLLLFAIMFMPLSAEQVPSGVVDAITDGRALSLHWWQSSFPPTLPLLHLAVTGSVSGEAYLILKMMMACAVPLLLSPIDIWPKFYAGACVLLAMYSMVGSAWAYPHIGFLVLLYLAWAFWTLPSLPQSSKRN